MSLLPDIVDSGALGWTLVISTRSNGTGEAKITWDGQGQLNPDFYAARTTPAAALESVLMRVERNGGVSPLDVPVLVGVLVGHFQARTR
ncbi:MAG: hypothetical protein J0I42_14900 [Bosea sp.]|uniref:hypothetical protein n=1 Tax=Bosea sp. (in: a-proteobacteria) TaxID=1871050 RepID=UPI001ACB7C92|nr:hypothetical protein [Bosea sp. (in: a-proteobacteria)]MBN9453234.1 hypothetical protein [Bosea sp. (in: a-proteobacteria)]